MANEIMDILDPFRKSLQADGADLKVLETDDQTLKMGLTISDATCLDCIVSKDLMKTIIVTELKKNGMKFQQFELVYPEI